MARLPSNIGNSQLATRLPLTFIHSENMMLSLSVRVIVLLLLLMPVAHTPAQTIDQNVATVLDKESGSAAAKDADQDSDDKKEADKKEADKKEADKKEADKKEAGEKKGKARTATSKPGDRKKTLGRTRSEDKDEQDEAVDPARLRVIRLSGVYVDLIQPVQFNPISAVLGEGAVKQRSFYKLCGFIDELAEEEEFQYVAFDLSDPVLIVNGAQLDELKRRFDKLKAAGITTYAWMESASTVHLSIAAQCDHVILADLGSIDFPSRGMQSMFFRDAMDLVGVKASVVRAGDFKGAVEPFVNSKMSDHLREHYRKMLTSMNDATVQRIARGRGLKPAEVREMQAQRVFLPKEALAAGLVDQLAPYGSMKSSITRACGEPLDWITAKQQKKKEMSFFQLMGEVMAGPGGSSARLNDNTIVVVHLSGAIVDGQKAASGRIVSGPTVALIDKIANEEKIKGCVIRINSPGGSATASESIRQALARLTRKKPCAISMGDMAASGGYWISCIDAPIYAEKETLTGSIGVFSLKMSTGALMRRIGVHVETIALDESAKLFALDRPWSDDDTQVLQKAIDVMYSRFLKLVSSSRDIPINRLEKIAGGRVWSGAQARKLKLIDFLGGVDDAVEDVAKKAGLGTDFEVIHRPLPKVGLDLSELLGNQGEEEVWQGVSRIAIQSIQKRGLSLQTTRILLNDALGNVQGPPTMWLLIGQEMNIR